MSQPPEDVPARAAAPGWYDDGRGAWRYWDGVAWTAVAPVASSPATGAPDEVTLALLTHLLAIFSSFIGPLLIYLIKGGESAFVKHHAAEALNFEITVFIAAAASAVLVIVLVGLVLLPVVLVGALILRIAATVAASRGEWYRYPVNLRLVPGALG